MTSIAMSPSDGEPRFGAGYPSCDVCRRPMLVGQHGRHFACCAGLGGRTPVCSPHRVEADKYRNTPAETRCAYCWRQQ